MTINTGNIQGMLVNIGGEINTLLTNQKDIFLVTIYAYKIFRYVIIANSQRQAEDMATKGLNLENEKYTVVCKQLGITTQEEVTRIVMGSELNTLINIGR